jgi:hypothetical protein
MESTRCASDTKGGDAHLCEMEWRLMQCMYSFVNVRACLCLCVCGTCACVYLVCVCVCARVCTDVCMHTHVHACIRIHASIRTYIYTIYMHSI